MSETPDPPFESVLGALRDAAEQAHGFMHFGAFTDCEAAICARRFSLSRALAARPSPAEPRTHLDPEYVWPDPEPAEPPAGDLRETASAFVAYVEDFRDWPPSDRYVELRDQLAAALRDPAPLAAEDRELGPEIDAIAEALDAVDRTLDALPDTFASGETIEALAAVAKAWNAFIEARLATVRSTTPPEPEDGGT